MNLNNFILFIVIICIDENGRGDRPTLIWQQGKYWAVEKVKYYVRQN